jgi:hypothetical protein
MNRRDELDAMYVILYKGCAGMDCMDCPGREYDHCGDYNKAVKLYDAGWRRQTEAEWVMKNAPVVCYECSNCGADLPFGLLARYTPYCCKCGAKMIIEGEIIC